MFNSAQDNNVLTKCDKESNLPINFQPIPKRFMVWDTKYEKFLTVPMEIWQIVIHFRNRYHQLYDDSGNSRYVFCQSTNLFDKDRKEIWEGSIVRGQVFDDPRTRIVGVVVYRQQEFLIVNSEETHSESLFKFYEKEIEVIGHVLSNPELLQEEE